MTQRPRLVGRLVLIGLIAGLLFTALMALGVWQVQRLAWKHALIAQVEARLHAPPVDAPGPRAWAGIAAKDAYLRIRARGQYLPSHDVLVQASTVKGPGFWVMTPLRTDAGTIILVNRGFLAKHGVDALPTAQVVVTGLLRISEPKGGFLRSNDPMRERWFSRDVAAIAAAQHLPGVAPYFIDADAASSPPGGPIGGLTVVHFPDNHLVYALTWFALALMVAGAAIFLLRDAWRWRDRQDRTA